MFENLIATLKADKRKIVFTEGPDPRILEAASRLKKDGLLDSILVGNVDEVKSAAAAGGFDIEGMEIIDPAAYPEMDAMVARMVELRKGKMTEEQCRQKFRGECIMFENLIATLKADKRKIVFTEGPDPRILEAASRLKKDGLLDSILVGNVDEVKSAAAAGGFDIEGMEIIDPAAYPEMDAMVARMVELRKGKMTEEQCRAALSKGNYFGTMLVKLGKADALLGGATYSTADTVRPALQIIKTKPGNKIVSSCFILRRDGKDGGDELYAMGDCAININPSEDDLMEIAIETAKTAKAFGIDPKVAMLSYSTKGSGKGETVDMMKNATEKTKAAAPDLAVDGELQFDAAFSPVVAATKCKGSPVAGQANTFIFPDINAGNIGYKIAQRLGGFEAYGPILQGLNAPINDLSRGCNADEVYQMAIITAGLK